MNGADWMTRIVRRKTTSPKLPMITDLPQQKRKLAEDQVKGLTSMLKECESYVRGCYGTGQSNLYKCLAMMVMTKETLNEGLEELSRIHGLPVESRAMQHALFSSRRERTLSRSRKGRKHISKTSARTPTPQGNILVQHNEETIREIACAMLESAGYKCQQAKSPSEALHAIESGQRFDLVLCKVMECLEEKLIQRFTNKFPDIPMVVWGGRPISVFLQAMREGAYDYLQVPFEREQLVFSVRRAVEYHRLKTGTRAYASRLQS